MQNKMGFIFISFYVNAALLRYVRDNAKSRSKAGRLFVFFLIDYFVSYFRSRIWMAGA